VARRHSVSAIKLFHDCPRKYKYRYIDRVKVPREQAGEPLRIGTAVHAGLEAAAKCMMAEEVTALNVQVTADADAAIEEAWVEEGLDFTDGSLERCKGWIRQTLEVWAEESNDFIAVEHKFLTWLPDGSGFIGFADRIDKVSETAIEIRDYKNTRDVTKAEKLLNDIQVNMYAYFARETWQWCETVYVSHQHPNHDGEVVRVRLTDDTIGEAVDRFLSTIEMIETEEEWTPRPSKACDWCDFTDICPAMEAKRNIDVDESAKREVLDF